MTESIHIPAGERGQIRVFALDMAPEQALFLMEADALAQVLGIPDIDLDHVEVFPVADLEDLGVDGYLIEGCGVPAEQIAPDRDSLRALNGHVLLLRSRAFGDGDVRLTPAKPIRLIGTYGERPTDWTGEPLASDSAQLYSAHRVAPRETRSRARRIGFTLFAVMMTLITILIVTLVT
jgi:hypothetical protein